MNKKINIALIALLAFGAMSASAQTATDSTGTASTDAATVTTTNTTTGTTGTVGLPPKPILVPGIRPMITVPKQTQGSTFGERAKALRATTTEIRKDIKDLRGEIKDKRGEIKDAKKENREEIKEKIKENKDKLAEKRLEIAKKQAELIIKRLNTAIERVQKLSNRVAERLTKLEAEGVTATVSRGHLADAKTKLDEATAQSATIKVAIETALASATPKEELKKVQDLVKATTKVIQEAHKHVALAISTVKPGLNKPRPATTTSPVATTTTATTTQ